MEVFVPWTGGAPVLRKAYVETPSLRTGITALLPLNGESYGGPWDYGEGGAFMFGRIVRE